MIDEYEFAHPDGTRKTQAERNAYREAKERAQQIARAESRDAEKRNATKTSPVAGHMETLKRDLEFAGPKERAAIKRRLQILKPVQDQWEAEQEQQARDEAFAKHDLCRLATEMTERIERSGSALYPAATQTELDQLVAIGKSLTDFPTPEIAYEVFSERLTAIETKEHQRATTAAADAEQAALKAEADAAKAKVTAAESQQRLNEVQG